MKITGRWLVLSACLVLSGGWALFDFTNGPAEPSSPAEQSASAPKAAASLELIAADTPEATSAVNPLRSISLASLTETIERPLFDPSRVRKVEEPPVAETVEAVAEKPSEGDFTLLAILVTNDDKIALLKWNKNDEVMRLKVGQTFSEWTLRAIEPKVVVIESAAATFELKLFQQLAPAAPKAVADPQDGEEPQDGENSQGINNISRL